MIDNVVFEYRRWQKKHEQIMSALGRDLRRGTASETGNANVIDDDFGIVFLSPLFHIGVIEPIVILRHKVGPLQDLEGFMLGPDPAWDDDTTPIPSAAVPETLMKSRLESSLYFVSTISANAKLVPEHEETLDECNSLYYP